MFLETNLFHDICEPKGTEDYGSYFGTAFGGMNQPPTTPLKDVFVTVNCTLVEFYCGVKKIVEYKRQVVGLDGVSVKEDTASVEIFVKRGMESGTKMLLPGLGNCQPKHKPTDLHVTLK